MSDYSINQFQLVDERAVKFQTELDDARLPELGLLGLCLPILSYVQVVASLEDEESLDGYRQRVIKVIKNIKRSGAKVQIANTTLDQLCFFCAAFIDDIVLHESKTSTIGWQNSTLVSELFTVRNGGEVFFSLTNSLREDAFANIELLQVAFVFIQLGYRGRYYGSSQAPLMNLVTELDMTISELYRGSAPSLLPDTKQTTAKSKILRSGFQPLTFAVMAAAVLALSVAINAYYFSGVDDRRRQELVLLDQRVSERVESSNPHRELFTEDKIASSDYARSSLRSNNPGGLSVTQPTVTREQAKGIADDSSGETTQKLNSKPIQASGYWVQIAFLSLEDDAQQLLKKCQNEQYLIEILKKKKGYSIGTIVTSRPNAVVAARYLERDCVASTYIKKMK
jgi:type VI secretion system protein ImpK|tara:strand:- start:146 stop:1333 length:1188 start_codon:yes stop_codon:yes gene_type:complete